MCTHLSHIPTHQVLFFFCFMGTIKKKTSTDKKKTQQRKDIPLSAIPVTDDDELHTKHDEITLEEDFDVEMQKECNE